ncbi:hypothetical protein [Exiguobacterium artemiae]|uniref:hypothetical protein n=1 Tax=Exiguobacterium artemiae TaxID=340145 RepID=UPI002964B754|nr:hypothetical protein [Exiguobacterium sibiricum]MDW2885206.1 hypothetical protein [Exiguobacterium sibiricum]
MKKRLHMSIKPSFILAGLIVLMIITLVFVQRHLNSIQIESIVEQANERGFGYELVIHEPITNSYSFRAFEQE